MRLVALLPLMFWVLGGCAPDASGSKQAQQAPRTQGSAMASAAPGAKSAPSDVNEPSYEVSIASAEADRVRARELCDSGDLAQRHACIAAADAAYDRAKSVAETTRNAAP